MGGFEIASKWERYNLLRFAQTSQSRLSSPRQLCVLKQFFAMPNRLNSYEKGCFQIPA